MVRKALKNDCLAINALGKELNDNFDTLFHIDKEIENKDALVLVKTNNQKVIGFLYAYNAIDNIDLLSIVVDKSYRHKHIASELLTFLIDNYCYQKPIILEVASNNEYAIMLYKKFDFKIINVRKKYYNGIDAYVMKRG